MAEQSLDETMFRGFYPPVHHRSVLPSDWYASYVQTYVERDVQQVLRVKEMNKFRLLLKLCAGRTGQLLNLSGIGNDAGVSHNTIKEWLSVLEASYITFRLPPHVCRCTSPLYRIHKCPHASNWPFVARSIWFGRDG